MSVFENRQILISQIFSGLQYMMYNYDKFVLFLII